MIVFDLDGVLIDCSVRKQMLSSGDISRHEYEVGAACDTDMPINDAVKVVQTLCAHYDIMYLTGRRKTAFDATYERLEELGFPMHQNLIMQPIGETTIEYKEQNLSDLVTTTEVVAFVDDSEENREAGKRVGIPVYGTIHELLRHLKRA